MGLEKYLEKLEEPSEEPYIKKEGNIPVILTAPHTMEQHRLNGEIKHREPLTRAIAKYVSEKTGCSYLIKEKDTLLDSNWNEVDAFKVLLEEMIKKNNIKLLIDIHGASKNREFDVELGTLNNLSADFSTIEELKDALIENNIKEIATNDPFKGGGITKYIFGTTDIDVVQIEINRKYRDLDEIEKVENICNALIKFINQYAEIQK